MANLFLSCGDGYQRVGEEAVKKHYPQGIATDFTLTYTEVNKELTSQDSSATRIIAVLKSPLNEDYDNQGFKYKVFPNGLQLDVYDEKNQKSIIQADYGIIYSQTNLIDLQGNVVLESHDGKKLETPQLYWDRRNKWIFTEAEFTYTNPEDGTIMDGKGMDFNREFTFFSAHKTYGLMTIKENEEL
ncbi:MAG: LPS export ABC transporter periplasmic protein LptC [Bacteroidota bacterium]